MMRFTIREVLWLTALVALFATRFIDRENALTQLLRVAEDYHKADRELDARLDALEGWAASMDKRYEEEVKRGGFIERDLGTLVDEVDRLKQKTKK
jgi:hypothetical protein